jgi:hypothetical protein
VSFDPARSLDRRTLKHRDQATVSRARLACSGGKQAVASCPTLCPQSSAPFGFAGLLIEFANPHLFFDAASLDELAEAANRLLRRFSVP